MTVIEAHELQALKLVAVPHNQEFELKVPRQRLTRKWTALLPEGHYYPTASWLTEEPQFFNIGLALQNEYGARKTNFLPGCRYRGGDCATGEQADHGTKREQSLAASGLHLCDA